jgi:hypothetical protein
MGKDGSTRPIRFHAVASAYPPELSGSGFSWLLKLRQRCNFHGNPPLSSVTSPPIAARLILEIDIGERLSAVVTDDKATSCCSTDQAGDVRRLLPQFAFNFCTRITDSLDRSLYPFLALAALFGCVPDFIVLTACHTSPIRPPLVLAIVASFVSRFFF